MFSQYPKNVAYHEAGRATARVFFHAVPFDVKIWRNGRRPIHIAESISALSVPEKYVPWNLATIIMAGCFAEARQLRLGYSYFWPSERSDVEALNSIYSILVKARIAESKKIAQEKVRTDARLFVRENWTSIERVAETLIKFGELSAAKIEKLARSNN